MVHVKANTVVADKQYSCTILDRFTNRNVCVLAYSGEFDGVRQQIPENLRNQSTVTSHGWQGRNFKRDLAAGQIVFKTSDHLTDHFIQIGGLEAKALLAQPGKPQQIIDEPLHPGNILLDTIQVIKTGRTKLLRVFLL